MGFLDETGLARVWDKVKSYIGTKVQTDVPANAVFTDTTYTLSVDAQNRLVLTPSSGTGQTLTVPFATRSTYASTVMQKNNYGISDTHVLLSEATSSDTGDVEGPAYHHRSLQYDIDSETLEVGKLSIDGDAQDLITNASNKWDGTNTSLKDAISSLNSNKANTIKFKNSTNIPASNFTSGMYLNNYLNLDSGYSVLCYLYVISNGWVLNSPYYITNNGRLWGATAPSGNLQVYYLEIKN